MGKHTINILPNHRTRYVGILETCQIFFVDFFIFFICVMQHKFLHCEQHGEGMRHLTRIFQRFLAFMTLMLAVVAPALADNFPTLDNCDQLAYNYLSDETFNCNDFGESVGMNFEHQGCTCKCANGGAFNFALVQDPGAAQTQEHLCLDDAYLSDRDIKCDIPGQHIYFTDPNDPETYGAVVIITVKT